MSVRSVGERDNIKQITRCILDLSLIISAISDSVPSVSYTHLDVYKRQQQ